MTNAPGRTFVAWYYRNGPIAANFIADKPLAKAAIKLALYPLIGFSFLFVGGFLPYLYAILALAGFITLALLKRRSSPEC